MNNHSYEEIRAVILDIISGKEKVSYDPNQYGHVECGVAEVLAKRESISRSNGIINSGNYPISSSDKNLVLEIFWALFREGIITLGLDSSNREFPFFRLSIYGQKVIDNEQTYFFHDVSSYRERLENEIPNLDEVTKIYLQEAMQSFRVGCLLASSVMLGVATEHTFNRLIEAIDQSATYKDAYKSVSKEQLISRRLTKFKNVFDSKKKDYPTDICQDFDSQFLGIQTIIKNYRNDSGHPTGKIIDREQMYVLLNLFIPYGKKTYELIQFFKGDSV